jgi:Lrp/AsnC family transcriptional regulator, leucine-responsive regulatory protein
MKESLTAFIFVQTEYRAGDAAMLLVRVPEVQEVHRVTGEDSYVVKVRVSSTEQLADVVSNKIERIKSVSSTRTTLVLKTLKEAQASGARTK